MIPFFCCYRFPFMMYKIPWENQGNITQLCQRNKHNVRKSTPRWQQSSGYTPPPCNCPGDLNWITFALIARGAWIELLSFLLPIARGGSIDILSPRTAPPKINQNHSKYDRILKGKHMFFYWAEERSEQGTLGGLIFEPPPPRRFKDQTSSSPPEPGAS